MILEKDGKHYTPNYVPGVSVYGEELIRERDVEYRYWDPHRSKLAALLRSGGDIPVDQCSSVLYLGAGDGTTVSHLSDLLTEGVIVAVELSSRPFRNLLSLTERRDNILPVMADARYPEEYDDLLGGVDYLYQDISQQDQVDIFIKNLKHFGPERAAIAVKSRSIDVTREPVEIYNDVKGRMKQEGFNVVAVRKISRWQKDHAIVSIDNRG